ncbi:hypothetical protein [Limnospira fusiformis]|uniref:hypothetical protein n=1 Tax=Limnospira fusiformis TaxID=54297 RepID=UPI0034E06129
MTDRIFAPNLYLCAYHLREDDTEGDTHPLWSNCDRLLSHLTDTRLTPHLHITQNRILLTPPKKQISFTFTDSPDIEGFIQPVQIQDSYGVFLNIGYDDTDTTNIVEILAVEQFNPHQILPFPQTPYFLGQTLLLTLHLTPENQDLQGSELTELANQSYQALFHQKTSPSRLGELFGSPIFEYGNPREPDKSPHILVWLFRDEMADTTLGKCFQLTFDLFLYRHKVTKAFQDSREIYQQLKQYYLSLDPTLDAIQSQIDATTPDPENNAYLQHFKTQLKQLAADSLIYDRLLRKIKDLLNTININLNNYNETIERICATLGTDKEELSFWRHFGEQTAPQFRGQIAADLSYFEQGTGLISQAIASIRAIVEIDQAQCDRQRQQAEADYYRKQQKANGDLQNHIQAVGVGIAAGAIVASTSGLITEPWERPDSDRFWLPYIHPFIIALLGSILCSWGAWWVAEKLIKRVK